MIFPGPARRDPDRAAAEVWAAVASGLGGRMFEALRRPASLAIHSPGVELAERPGPER